MSSGEWMWGGEGFFQGDPYAGRAHDTLLQAALIQAAEVTVQEYRQVIERKEARRDPVSEEGSLTEDDLVLLAFRDDVYVVGEAEIAMMANEKIDVVREEVTGVKENRAKTSAYVPIEAHSTHEGWLEARDTVAKSYIVESEISTEGMKMVGAPVGNAGYCHDFLEKASAKYPHFLPRISTMDTQIAMILLRECHLPIYTHLIRMVHPKIMQEYARVLDRQIIKTYNTINNQHDANWTNNPNNPIMRGVRQPFRLGGMGLRSVEMVSPIAYYASSVAAIRLITEEIDPTLRMLVQELGSKPIPPHNPPIPPDQEEGDEFEALFGSESPATQGESPPSSIHTQPAPLNMQAGQHGERESEEEEIEGDSNPDAHPAPNSLLAGQRQETSEARARDNTFTAILVEAWEQIMNMDQWTHIVMGQSSLLDAFPRSAAACCFGALEAPPKMQNVLTKAMEGVNESVHKITRNQVEKVRAREAKASGAKGACLAMPRTKESTLPPDAAKFATTYRMGTAAAPDISHCPCGTGSPSITHILSCRNLRGRFVRHDVLVNVLVDMLRTVGITASAEVMILEDSQKRMDIVATLASGRVWVDVSVVNPLIGSYINDKNPLVTRQNQKQAKYGDLARTSRVRFIPFVVSTFGGLGPMATELLQWIASEAYERGLVVATSGAEHAIGQYRWGLIQQVGVATAHANSCMVQEARIRAVHPKTKTTAIFKAVLKRGYKSSIREAAARVYVYNAEGAPKKAAAWPKGAMHARAGGRNGA